jgi:hypothetical protein
MASKRKGSISADDAAKQYAWSVCRPCAGFDEDDWRFDSYGRPMKWDSYGDRSAQYGWEIDHIRPLAEGGSKDHGNLQALHWQSRARRVENTTLKPEAPRPKPRRRLPRN